MARFCTQCGAPLEGARFCTQCGTRAEDPAVEKAHEEAAASVVASDLTAELRAASVEPAEVDLSGFDHEGDAVPDTGPVAPPPAPAYTPPTAPTQPYTQPNYQQPAAEQAPTAAYYAQPAYQATAVQPPAYQQQPATYQQPPVYQQPSAQKTGTSTGLKAAIVGLACVVGAGVGIALALLHPWAPDTPASSAASSQVAATEAAPAETSSAGEESGGEAQTENAQAPQPHTETPSATPAAPDPAPNTPQQDASSAADASSSNAGGNTSASAPSNQASGSGYIFADSATRYLSQRDIAGMSSDDLARAQNEIWARHGRKFKNKWLQDYFNAQSWYVGTIEPDDFIGAYRSTEIEDANASLIAQELASRGWDVNKAHPN